MFRVITGFTNSPSPGDGITLPEGEAAPEAAADALAGGALADPPDVGGWLAAVLPDGPSPPPDEQAATKITVSRSSGRRAVAVIGRCLVPRGGRAGDGPGAPRPATRADGSRVAAISP
ncbi:MAG: hypothetical protein H0V87_11655 [Chloroflexi bacterium]|nr:hypothetical protein [Chloroflexota bacterium]